MTEGKEEAVEAGLQYFREVRRRLDEDPHAPEPQEREWMAGVIAHAAPAIRKQVQEEERERVREALEFTALRLDCDCPARSDEQLDNHADECPFGVAARLIRSIDREECDCDPDGHIAANCRSRGCRESRVFDA